MNEYDLMNLYFNFIFKDGNKSFRYVYASYEQLVEILYKYADEKFAKQIARKIEKEREIHPIDTTFQLVDIIKEAIPAYARRKGGHPAKRTFQALRIAVNDELNVFDIALKDALDLLNLNGRISVITFHSLEDKICKYK